MNLLVLVLSALLVGVILGWVLRGLFEGDMPHGL